MTQPQKNQPTKMSHQQSESLSSVSQNLQQSQPQNQPANLPSFPIRVLMMAAGTGGHVFPALAVAKALEQNGVEVHWLGTPTGMEGDLVKAHYPFHAIHMKGLRGNGIKRLLQAPFALLNAVLEAKKIIQSQQIDIVVGFGGYVTAPGGVAAWLCGKPVLIHEQNAIAGMSNRYLAKIAKKIMQAFEGTFTPSEKVITVGNPVRAEICAIAPPQQRWQQKTDSRLNLLIVGGSLGAVAINQTIPQALALLEQQSDQQWQVRHQCGKNNLEATQALYQQIDLKIPVEILPFINNMAEAYAWADVIVCRAGALTVSEIANIGLPAIFIPLPHAVDDHQTKNAKLLVDKNAGFLLPQSQLTPQNLADILKQITLEIALKMAENAKTLANPSATQMASEQILTFSPPS